MSPVDAQRGKVLAEHGLKHFSNEAIAQAVLTKEADLEWKRLSALASAWEIEARSYTSSTSQPLISALETIANSDLDSAELQSRMAFAISSYSEDKSSYSAADAQLDHLEYLARERYDSEAFEDHMPTSPTDLDASASSSDEDDSAMQGIAKISTKSDD
ncbi:hypothetical protein EDD22DRAFT_962149 [Suillus occidentalis]|nr:hypothetical protein EDD22DRAFT_962149 [Suillus occidentalis]